MGRGESGGGRGRDEKCKVDSLAVFWEGHKRQGLLLFLSLPREREGKGKEKEGKEGKIKRKRRRMAREENGREVQRETKGMKSNENINGGIYIRKWKQRDGERG